MSHLDLHCLHTYLFCKMLDEFIVFDVQIMHRALGSFYWAFTIVDEKAVYSLVPTTKYAELTWICGNLGIVNAIKWR